MEKIIKIAKNNVEVQTIYYKDKLGKEEFVHKIDSYGQGRIDKELAELTDEMAYWDNVVIEDEKANIQAKIDKLNSIQTEMNKVDETEEEVEKEVEKEVEEEVEKEVEKEVEEEV